MHEPWLLTLLSIEREAFRTLLLLVVIGMAVVAGLPRVLDVAAAAFR